MFLRIFDRYIGRQISSATLIGVVILSGVMVLGNVFQKMEQLLGNSQLPMAVVAKFIWLVIPYSLIFTIPWAFLTAILLVFGRMSADNELVSLRMTGSSMPRICLPVFLVSLTLSGFCYWANVELAPSAKNEMKRLFYTVAMEDPSSLFQEGRVLDRVPGYRIYTDKKVDGKMQGLVLMELEGNRVLRTIRARVAYLDTEPGMVDPILRLQDADVEMPKLIDNKTIEGIDVVHMDETAVPFPISKMKEKLERVNVSMKSTPTLWQESRTQMDTVTNLPHDKKQHSECLTELNRRYSLSLACLTFALVGIPLGVTAQRRETSVGFALSLGTGLLYMMLILVGDVMSDRPSVFPHLLVWSPNLIFLGLGFWLFARLSRK